MNMHGTEHWTDRLSEYLDGDLAASEREGCEAHLAGCAGCAGLLEELKAVAAEARALPPVPPPADLWRGIESRLETPVLQLRPRSAIRERLARRWSFSGLQLMGAAAALVAVTIGAMWMATARGPANRAPAPANGPVAVNPEAPAGSTSAPTAPDGDSSANVGPSPSAPAPGGTALASNTFDHSAPTQPADFGVQRYDAAIAELQASLDQRRSKLSPETIRIVEENLEIVDKAIADARAALAKDPASQYLNAHLASTMRRKVDLLRRLNSLTRV